ncbi:unnamed protein product [Chrysoparadoxa australica]
MTEEPPSSPAPRAQRVSGRESSAVDTLLSLSLTESPFKSPFPCKGGMQGKFWHSPFVPRPWTPVGRLDFTARSDLTPVSSMLVEGEREMTMHDTPSQFPYNTTGLCLFSPSFSMFSPNPEGSTVFNTEPSGKCSAAAASAGRAASPTQPAAPKREQGKREQLFADTGSQGNDSSWALAVPGQSVSEMGGAPAAKDSPPPEPVSKMPPPAFLPSFASPCKTTSQSQSQISPSLARLGSFASGLLGHHDLTGIVADLKALSPSSNKELAFCSSTSNHKRSASSKSTKPSPKPSPKRRRAWFSSSPVQPPRCSSDSDAFRALELQDGADAFELGSLDGPPQPRAADASGAKLSRLQPASPGAKSEQPSSSTPLTTKAKRAQSAKASGLFCSPPPAKALETKISPPGAAQQERAVKCNCRKSKCLKLYCECFQRKMYCSDCNCQDCHNSTAMEGARQAAIKAVQDRNPAAFKGKFSAGGKRLTHSSGCNCKRSACLKKYCECFSAGTTCGAKCKCVNCENFEGSKKRKNKKRPAPVAQRAEKKQGVVVKPVVQNFAVAPSHARQQAQAGGLNQIASMDVKHDPYVDRGGKSNYRIVGRVGTGGEAPVMKVAEGTAPVAGGGFAPSQVASC